MPCKNHPHIEDGLTRCARCAESFCPDCIVQIGGYPYCADCKVEAMRNLQSGLPAVGRQLEMASIGRRFLALWIDGLILVIPLLILTFAIAIPSGMFDPEAQEEPAAALVFQGLLTLAYVGFGIAYEGVMLASGGQTIGKKALRIKVVTPEGNDITRGQAWTRAVVRQVLSAVPCLGLIDYLVAFGAERACIHDQAAKTRVVNWGI